MKKNKTNIKEKMRKQTMAKRDEINTQKDLIQLLAEKLDTSVVQATKMYQAMKECVYELVADENKQGLDLHGLVKFDVKFVAEHEGRNPSTGEKMIIPSKNRVSAKPSSALKKVV